MYLGSLPLRTRWQLVASFLLCLAIAPANAFTLRVALEQADNRPFEYLDDHGKLTGFHVELVREVCSLLGWEVRFERLPWKRALGWLADGHVQALTYIARSQERESYAWFLPDNVLHVQRVSLYVRKERVAEIPYQPHLADMMNRWRFGAVQGYFYNEEINALLKSGLPIDQSAVTQASLLAMLLKNRIDVAIVIVGAIDQAQRDIPDIRERIQRIEGALFTGTPSYIAFTRKQDGDKWAEQFASAYKRWRSSPNYARLVARFHVVDSVPDAYISK